MIVDQVAVERFARKGLKLELGSTMEINNREVRVSDCPAKTGAKVTEAQAALDRTTVRAPKDADLLQVNIHEGGFSRPFLDGGAMVIGDLTRLQVCVDIDESNASRISPQAKALAFAKGDTKKPVPLKFSRIELLVIPKKSLAGEKPDRVDTRVLQVVYTFDRPDWPLSVGQQVDVFIEAKDDPSATGPGLLNASSADRPSTP